MQIYYHHPKKTAQTTVSFWHISSYIDISFLFCSRSIELFFTFSAGKLNGALSVYSAFSCFRSSLSPPLFLILFLHIYLISLHHRINSEILRTATDMCEKTEGKGMQIFVSLQSGIVFVCMCVSMCVHLW